jgi:hypothetical protein
MHFAQRMHKNVTDWDIMGGEVSNTTSKELVY